MNATQQLHSPDQSLWPNNGARELPAGDALKSDFVTDQVIYMNGGCHIIRGANGPYLHL
ncbi:MAG: hypothetical protein Q8Q76_07280 [Methylotenera sp.]|nr:hypothetical protein [Methylotenera sp.]